MLDKTKDIATPAEAWFAEFESALANPGQSRLKTLFHSDSYWRDVLALTWDFRTVNGADAIVSELKAHAGRAGPAGFAIDPDRTAPRNVTRAGRTARIRTISRRA